MTITITEIRRIAETKLPIRAKLDASDPICFNRICTAYSSPVPINSIPIKAELF